MSRRLRLSGNAVSALAELKGGQLVKERKGKRVYRSPADPSLIVVVTLTDYPLPEDEARAALDILGITDEDLQRWFP